MLKKKTVFYSSGKLPPHLLADRIKIVVIRKNMSTNINKKKLNARSSDFPEKRDLCLNSGKQLPNFSPHRMSIGADVDLCVHTNDLFIFF